MGKACSTCKDLDVKSDIQKSTMKPNTDDMIIESQYKITLLKNEKTIDVLRGFLSLSWLENFRNLDFHLNHKDYFVNKITYIMLCERILYCLSYINEKLTCNKEQLLKIMQNYIGEFGDYKFQLNKFKKMYSKLNEQSKTITCDIEKIQMAFKYDSEITLCSFTSRKLLSFLRDEDLCDKSKNNKTPLYSKKCKSGNIIQSNDYTISTRANASTEYYVSEYIQSKTVDNSPYKTSKTNSQKKKLHLKSTQDGIKAISQAALNYFKQNQRKFENMELFSMNFTSFNKIEKTSSKGLVFKELYKEDIPEFESNLHEIMKRYFVSKNDVIAMYNNILEELENFAVNENDSSKSFRGSEFIVQMFKLLSNQAPKFNINCNI